MKFGFGKDGKSAYRRTHGQPCRKPIVQPGEFALCFSLDASATDENKVEPKRKDGIEFGAHERTNENIIGTDVGIVRDNQRKGPEHQRNGRPILTVKGTVSQPAPGHNADRIPTVIVDGKGKTVQRNPGKTSSTDISCPRSQRPDWPMKFEH